MDDGTTVVAHARKGVIIASGGYAANIKKVIETNKYWPAKYLSYHMGTTNRSSLLGEGLSMATEIGADECGEGWTQLLPLAFSADGLIAKGSVEKAGNTKNEKYGESGNADKIDEWKGDWTWSLRWTFFSSLTRTSTKLKNCEIVVAQATPATSI